MHCLFGDSEVLIEDSGLCVRVKHLDSERGNFKLFGFIY